jgi:uncharacterized phage protein (TIGR02218 family)
MRALDPRLQARLDGGATTLCRCWRLDRRDGSSLGFTDHDEDLTFDGVTFSARSGVSGSSQETATGLAPGSVEMEGALRSDSMSERDIAAGLWDGARVRRWLVDWREPDVRALLFDGALGEITCEGAAFRAEALGPGAGLNRAIGRAFMRGCDAALGDARCGVNLSAPSMRATGVVTRTMGADRFEAALGVGGAGHGFADGALTWTTGANAGSSAPIAADGPAGTGRSFALAAVPTGGVAIGDAFIATVGCDRSFATCRDRFSNILNFRGFPHLPGDDWVGSYPGPGEATDGGTRLG